MAADKLNTSGSIVISDDSSTDTDYEPSPKRGKLEELGGSGGSSAGCSSANDKGPDVGSEAPPVPTPVPLPNSESPPPGPAPHRNNVTVLYGALPPVSCSSPPLADQYRGQIFHTCTGSFTFEELMNNLDRDRSAGTRRRIRRLGMRAVRRRSSNSNSQPPQSQGEVQNVSDPADPEEVSNSATSSTEPENDDENDGIDPEGRNPIVTSPDPNGYMTDPMDPDEINEIPSDLEFSPPRPLTPPRPSPRHRERRNAIFERRDPPPPPVSAREIEDDQFYHNEFEVASVSDINENPIEDANSTSGTENNLDSISELNDTFVEAPNLSDNHFADADSETMKSDPEANSDETHNSSVRSKGLNSSDSEISEKDKWFCSQCHAKCMPYLRYCLRCFKTRRNWLPKRPPSRRLKRRKRAQRKSNPANTSKTTITSDSDDVVDGPPQRNAATNQSSAAAPTTDNAVQLVDPCSSSQLRTVLPAGPAVNLDEGFLIDDGNPASNRLTSNTPPGNRTLIEIFTPPESQSSNVDVTQRSQKSDEETTEVDSPAPASSTASSSQSQPSGFSQTSSQSQSTQSSGEFLSPPLPQGSKQNQPICNICYARAKDAAFVHNKVAHQYCCYVCADKILKRDGKCPICRERVLRVVKVIIV